MENTVLDSLQNLSSIYNTPIRLILVYYFPPIKANVRQGSLRAGELISVHVPTPEEEALRDLMRMREVKEDLGD